MKIAIFIDACRPFDGQSGADPKLGVTERAVIDFANAWHAQGHNLRVLTPAPNPAPVLPLYLPNQATAQIGPVDLLLVVREWRAFFLNWKAKKKVFFALDKLSDFCTFGIADKRCLERFDFILCPDSSEVKSFCELSTFPQKRIKALPDAGQDDFELRARQLLELI